MSNQFWDNIRYWIGRRPRCGLDRGFLENSKQTFNSRVEAIGERDSVAYKLAKKLQEDIDEQIRWMHEYKMYHRKRYLLFQQAKIWLSCFATISIALAALYKTTDVWNAVAIVTSALVTTIALLERTHNHRDLWLLNTNYCHRICRLYTKFNDGLLIMANGKESVEKQIALFRAEFLKIDTEFRRAVHISYEDSVSEATEKSQKPPKKPSG
ncbi:TPA: SLATT domain-containing protein [Vibrio parahaemolyticus]|nr:SLATT domain-containing protein [Vibrio parahaemolyticus]